MAKRHLKSLAAPRSWNIKRKKSKFITRPYPGMYRFSEGLPISLVLKDSLKLCKTNKEVKYVLNKQEIKIDGVRRKDPKFLVGLFDIINIPKLKQSFRVLINKRGKIELKQLKDETLLKPCKVTGKALVKKRMQLNLYDGRNILIDKDSFKVGDTLIIELPGQVIKEHLKFEEGALAYLTKGKNVGEFGKIERIKGGSIVFKKLTGEKFETKRDYAFIIGKDKPAIEL